MDQVGAWLHSIGLAEYAPRFAANHVDFDLLAGLSEQDLKELGIVSLGHRRRLVRAINEIKASPPVDQSNSPPRSPDPPPSRRHDHAAAERRNLTIVFIDLVDYVATARRLDPEEMGAIVRAYQACCTKAIADYDGVGTQYNAEHVIACFGYPRAHEDDAERAVRAALDLHRQLAGLGLKEPVRARIGIATGLVVVGDVGGGEKGSHWSVTGDAPNLASRLQALAEPSTTVVSATTRHLLGELFDLRDLGPQQVKGLTAPVPAFAVQAERVWASRFEARAADLTGLVGRADEREQLIDCKRLAWHGRGQVVLISGEAGIGKSRLTDWLVKKLPRRGSARIRYQCTPHHRDSWLYPLITQVQRAARLEPTDTPEEQLTKLETLLRLGGEDGAAAVPLFAALMRIPTGERYPPLGLSPQQQRERTMEAMVDQIEGLCAHQPALVVCEDAQWADPTSLEVLDRLVDRAARLPVLVVITTRPEFSPPWAGRHNVTVLHLQRLDRRQTRAMVESIPGGARLPVEVLERIVAKTDGIPLFVEELTKSVLESGGLADTADGMQVADVLPTLAIPATLQDSLMARLDRSQQVREVAQVGAAIGREFAYRLLAAVADLDEETLQGALAKLEAAGLASRRGMVPDATYTFKHALVQDAAHESLLKSRRQTIHRRIAEALRDLFPVQADTRPEIVARHFALAGADESAVEWWTRAGEQSLRRSASAESIAHFEKAIALADALPDDPVRHLRRYRLQVAYANAQLALHGYTGAAVIAAFKRCTELGHSIEDVIERFSGFYGIWAASFASGEAHRARELIETFVSGVGTLAAGQETAVGRRMLGLARWCSGDFTCAVPHLEATLAAYDARRDRPLAFRFGQDIGASTMIKLAVNLWPLGKAEAARGWAERAVAHARDIGHKQTEAFALCYKACFEAVRDDPRRAGVDALATLEIGRENDLNRFWAGLATALRGWARWRGGDQAAGEAEMQEGRAVLLHQEIGLYQPLTDALHAEVQAARDPEAARATLEAAVDRSGHTGQVWFDAELHRRLGLLALRTWSDTARAEACFEQSLAIARRQQTRAFELRTSLDLAKLLQDSGREAQARDLLPRALAGFDETPELPQIAEARRLMRTMGEMVGS